jgi:hypothetical protein
MIAIHPHGDLIKHRPERGQQRRHSQRELTFVVDIHLREVKMSHEPWERSCMYYRVLWPIIGRARSRFPVTKAVF